MGPVNAEILDADTLNTEPLNCGTLRLMLAYCGLTPGGMSAQAVAFMMVADEPGRGSVVLGHEHTPAEVVEVRFDVVCDDNDEKLRDDNDENCCDIVPDQNAEELCDVFGEDTEDALSLVLCEDVRKSLV